MLNHPYWENEDERDIYLFEFAMCIYETTCQQAAITYRNNRKFTPTECYNAIKFMPPPKLDFWIKRPDDCIVVSLDTTEEKKPHKIC